MRLSAGEKKRRQILEAALMVIAEFGVDAVTHRKVGSAAGVSHGVVSYHFPTRDDLILKAFEFFFGNFEDMQLRAGWTPDEVMTKRCVVEIMTNIVANELDESNSTLIEQELILVAARRPELSAIYRAWEEKGINSFAGGLKKSGFKNPKRTAHILTNFIRGFLLECLTDPTLTEDDFKKRANVLFAGFAQRVSEPG